MECWLRKEQLYVSLSFLTMKLVGMEGVPGRFLGSHPGGNLWHCPLCLRWWCFLRLWEPGYPPLRAGRKVPGWAVPRHRGPICRGRPAMWWSRMTQLAKRLQTRLSPLECPWPRCPSIMIGLRKKEWEENPSLNLISLLSGKTQGKCRLVAGWTLWYGRHV